MNRKIIGTVVIGEEYERMFQHTGPLLAKYAARIGAGLVVIGRRTMDRRLPPIFEKWAIASLLHSHDRVAIVDCDMVVMPNAPDIFERVPIDRFGSYDETSHKAWGDKWLHEKVLPGCFESIAAKRPQLLIDWEWNGIYLNAGLWVLGPGHLPLFSDPLESLEHASFICPEQTWMSFLVSRHDVEVERLPVEFNYMTHHKEHQILQGEQVHFYHVTMWNPPDGYRLGAVKKLAAEAARRSR